MAEWGGPQEWCYCGALPTPAGSHSLCRCSLPGPAPGLHLLEPSRKWGVSSPLPTRKDESTSWTLPSLCLWSPAAGWRWVNLCSTLTATSQSPGTCSQVTA